MIHPSDFELRIGFTRIREQLESHCLSPLGRRGVSQMTFLTDHGAVSALLQCNNEFLVLLSTGEAWPDKDYFDPSDAFSLARVEGACLTAQDLMHIRRSLRTIAAWVIFLKKNGERYPALAREAEPVEVPAALVTLLDRKIDDEGRIRDNATPEMARIRKAIISAESASRRLSESLFREASAAGYVPDGALPVFREGRVVIPVKAEHKRRVKGVIVDESATGQTIYMEPEALVEINNELRDLRHEEQREELRILRELTAELRSDLPVLLAAFGLLEFMDLHQAKARLSRDLDAEFPVLKPEPALEWKKARHPGLVLLLRGKRPVVPLDIRLEEGNRFLLVSGPNAGGKSVCLKTAGLVQYMTQCGLLPPASGDSVFGMFKDILLDIGDQQSLENDLSTYSSHLKNMAVFTRSAGGHSLVLIDEMGAGTDPAFGGGIAEAVLTDLIARKAWGVVTTHYANLKTLSTRTAGILNGAMLFDAERLTPMFLLDIGKPGSSYAMELARKSGLDREVIASAERLIGAGLVGLEHLMRKTETEKVQVERLRRELEQKERKLKDLTVRYEQMSAELEGRKKEIIVKAKESAAALLRDTNREIEKTIRHIRENKAEKKETKKIRQRLTDLKETVAVPEPVSVKAPSGGFREGDRVRLRGQDQSGTVLQVKGDDVFVQFGLLRSKVKAPQLEHSGDKPVESFARVTGIDLGAKRSVFRPEIDLRGKRADEVLSLLDAFMDDAVLLAAHELRILHGKGEGVLRKMIREHLSRNRHVAAMADEHADRGGAGITVVTMK